MRMRIRGVYTVEAVFIMSICVWVLIALCYGGIYVHDRVVLESVTNEETAAWLSSTERGEESRWRGDLEQELDKRLFLFRIRSVKVTSGWKEKKIRICYTMPVSWRLLKRIFMGNRSEAVYETSREDIVPAKHMWEMEGSDG